MAELRVGHGPIDPDVADSLTDAEKEFLRAWNRESEIPGEGSDGADPVADSLYPNGVDSVPGMGEGGEDADTSKYDDLTNDELRELLSERDLPTSGNKAELIERLVADDENSDDEDDDEDDDDPDA